MFTKEIKSLKEIKGIDASEITPEQISAINAEFAEKGFNVNVVSAAPSAEETTETIEETETVETTEEETLEQANARLSQELTSAQAQVQTLTHKVKTLEQKPAASHTPQSAKEDKVASVVDNEEPDYDAVLTAAIKEKHNIQ